MVLKDEDVDKQLSMLKLLTLPTNGGHAGF
jgi:hypothetical protein